MRNPDTMIHVHIIDGSDFTQTLIETLSLMAPDIHCTFSLSVPQKQDGIDAFLITNAHGKGKDFIRMIKEQGPTIPIIGMSVFSSNETGILKAGAEAFWAKSGLHKDLEELVALIRSLVPAA